MRIDEIDKNLLIQTDITEPDIVWLNVKDAPFVISGISYDEEQGVFVSVPIQGLSVSMQLPIVVVDLLCLI